MNQNILNEEQFNILRLSRSSNNVHLHLHKLLEKYDSFTEIIKNIHKINNKIILISEDDIKKEIEEHNKIGAKIITYIDDNYPILLKQSDSFPFVLSCKGNLDLLNNTRTVAIIGSRNCSINSFNFSKKTAQEVSGYGYVIVSGLARGIDSSAHLGSLENGTIAVLGSGIDVIYPKENDYLYHEIIHNNGLILSELPIHSSPKPEYFIMRNRIIAGLSRGVLVMEAGVSSGTMHTVKQALKLNRDVMIFPGSPYDDRCLGSNRLLQDGATMVIDTKDVVSCLESFMVNDCFNDLKFCYEVNEDNSLFINQYEKDMENDIKKKTIEEEILSKLDYTPIGINEVIDNLNYDVSTINSAITKLQLNKKVIVTAGRVCLRLG